MLTRYGVMIFSIRVSRSCVEGLLGWSWLLWWWCGVNMWWWIGIFSATSYNSNQLQLSTATIARRSCIRQLAIIRPVLTSLDFEIVNSILWKLSLILTKTVPNRKPTEGFLRFYRSKSTIRWVAGDHSTTVDRLKPPRPLSVIHEELPKWPAFRAAWCWPWQEFPFNHWELHK